MSKQEILSNIYNKLKFAGLVTSKKDFSETLDYNYTCLSAAFNGEERYLTDRFFKRLMRAYPQVNPDYIMSGEGEILRPLEEAIQNYNNRPSTIGLEIPTTPSVVAKVDIEKITEELAEQRKLTARAQEQTDRALAQIDQLIEIIRHVTINNNNNA